VPVRIIIPIIVVDELDNTKNRGDSHAKWRAAYNLAVFDRLFPGQRFTAAISNPTPKASVQLEILFDPPRHVRLPINDDELIDRVLAAQPLTGQNITLITCDTNQSMRARHAGLAVIKVPGDARKQAPPRSKP
jgi:predicted ribonuclease YlaK